MLPPFYKQCFDAWSDLNNEVSLSFQGIVNEIIWKNKFLCVNKKIGLSKAFFFSISLLEIGDLLSCNNTTTSTAQSWDKIFLCVNKKIGVSKGSFFFH